MKKILKVIIPEWFDNPMIGLVQVEKNFYSFEFKGWGHKTQTKRNCYAVYELIGIHENEFVRYENEAAQYETPDYPFWKLGLSLDEKDRRSMISLREKLIEDIEKIKLMTIGETFLSLWDMDSASILKIEKLSASVMYKPEWSDWTNRIITKSKKSDLCLGHEVPRYSLGMTAIRDHR